MNQELWHLWWHRYGTYHALPACIWARTSIGTAKKYKLEVDQTEDFNDVILDDQDDFL